MMKKPLLYLALITSLAAVSSAYAKKIQIIGENSEATIEQTEAARTHALGLLKAAGKNPDDYTLNLSWGDSAKRVDIGTCKIRYQNRLDSRTTMQKCLLYWQQKPDFWKAHFIKLGSTIPRETCIFTFDEKHQPSEYYKKGCGFKK